MKHFIQMTAVGLLVGAPVLADQDDLNLYGQKGYVPQHEMTQDRWPTSMPEDRYQGVKSNYPVTSHVHASDYQCPPNFSGMFRGTLYCADGVLMR